MIVVADTSVLINLCRVGQGGLFKGLFQEVVIPPEVAKEFCRLEPVLDALWRDAGFWISESLRQQVLKLAGEKALPSSGS